MFNGVGFTPGKLDLDPGRSTGISRQRSTNPDDYIAADDAARQQFMKQTGYPKGRPGFVVMYKTAICDGGVDEPSNMRWRKVQNSRPRQN
jgi:hypothetical protein